MSSHSTHVSLLARLADAQDLGAWSDFVDRYGELIMGFCRRRGLQQADCDDIRQDVLASLAKSMPGFAYDPAKGKFRSYLKTAVLNAISRRMFQNRHAAPLEEFEDTTRAGAPDADEPAWEAEWRQYHLRLAMKTIRVEFGETDRAAFEHYAVGGLDAARTASLLGVSVDQVYQAKSRITRRLGQLIEQQVGEEG